MISGTSKIDAIARKKRTEMEQQSKTEQKQVDDGEQKKLECVQLVCQDGHPEILKKENELNLGPWMQIWSTGQRYSEIFSHLYRKSLPHSI